jgi:AraC-like DNA-binding protein
MRRPHLTDRALFASPEVRVGTFDCPVDHPDFATAGPIEGYTIFFPRSAVWIEHDGQPPFVADPKVVTIYNRGQPYVRRALAVTGDRGDWLSVSRELAAAVASGLDPDTDPDRPFPVSSAPSSLPLYYRQRRLVIRLRHHRVPPFEVEHEVIALIGATLEAVLPERRKRRRATTERVQREVVERVKAELARDPARSPTIREVAAAADISPFHLCRLFRRRTGQTLHDYLLDLRTRLMLERIEDRAPGLSRLAHELGFSSHSHLSLTVRRRLGASPSRIRSELRAIQ